MLEFDCSCRFLNKSDCGRSITLLHLCKWLQLVCFPDLTLQHTALVQCRCLGWTWIQTVKVSSSCRWSGEWRWGRTNSAHSYCSEMNFFLGFNQWLRFTFPFKWVSSYYKLWNIHSNHGRQWVVNVISFFLVVYAPCCVQRFYHILIYLWMLSVSCLRKLTQTVKLAKQEKCEELTM